MGETISTDFTLAAMDIHEEYNPVTIENDIALLTLDHAVTFTKNIYPICLPAMGHNFANQRASVVGWGLTIPGNLTSASDVPRVANVNIWDNAKCNLTYGGGITEGMLCANDPGEDSCRGDSGGPLNCFRPSKKRFELCGIVSWGKGCAKSDYPGVYTRTNVYLEWVYNTALRKLKTGFTFCVHM